MSEQLDNLTVIELRRLAREKGITLPAGINKQGIVDRLRGKLYPQSVAAQRAQTPAPDAGSAAPKRASIIADDDYEDQDIPVLSAKTVNRYQQNPVQVTDRTQQRQPAKSSDVLSTISSKAPAFSIEGVRAWHNPRAFQQTNYQPGVHTYQRTPAQSSAPRTDYRQQNHNAPQTAQRFGPAEENSAASQEETRTPRYSSDPRPYTPHQRDQEPQPLSLNRDGGILQKTTLPELLAQSDCQDLTGVLALRADGGGILTGSGADLNEHPVLINATQVRRFNLRAGDAVGGKVKPPKDGEMYRVMLYITTVNGSPVDDMKTRPAFLGQTVMPPTKRMSFSGRRIGSPALKLIDLTCPLGYGQRLLVEYPDSMDRLRLLSGITETLSANHGKLRVILLMVGEKPEDIAQLKSSEQVEIMTADICETAEGQAAAVSLAVERAMRLCEQRLDVLLVISSLPELMNAVLKPADALRALGAGRAFKEGGSLTTLALTPSAHDYPAFERVASAQWRVAPSEEAPFALDLAACRNQFADNLLTDAERELAEQAKSAN
ncbi:MAG: hypothetical protein IJ240_02630 [Clostridia bacterium]|nr:hypothetical protein [Clostridia bacterium]